jgi:DNA-binding MarR family transcriptional regulator
MSRINEELLMVELFRLSELIDNHFVDYMKLNGLSDSLYNVLRILRGAGMPIPSQTIAERLISRRPDITRLVDKLDKQGLVKRKRCDKDRRIVYIGITEKGLKLLTSMDETMMSKSQTLLSCLSDKECKQFDDLLSKLNKHIAK